MHTLTHSQPSITLSITVNLHADRSLLLLIGLLWLAANQVRRRRFGVPGGVLRHGLVVWIAEAVMLVRDVAEAVGFTVGVFGIAVSAVAWGVIGVELWVYSDAK